MAIYKDVPNVSDRLAKKTKRLPLVLCEDISGSMSLKYELLNGQLSEFFSIKDTEPQLSRLVDMEIIQFNETVTSMTTTLDKYYFTPFRQTDLKGTTHFWEALDNAIQSCEKYINNPRYWSPWILMYTDGNPNGDPLGLREKVIARLRRHEENNDILPFFLGIGELSKGESPLNLNFLSSISKRGSQAVVCAVNEKIDTKRFFRFMMRTIISTLSSARYFIADESGQKKMNCDLLYHEFMEYQNFVE